ncbi:hypothetical protein SNEBB_004860, partial [Seison nebaliae]
MNLFLNFIIIHGIGLVHGYGTRRYLGIQIDGYVQPRNLLLLDSKAIANLIIFRFIKD